MEVFQHWKAQKSSTQITHIVSAPRKKRDREGSGPGRGKGGNAEAMKITGRATQGANIIGTGPKDPLAQQKNSPSGSGESIRHLGLLFLLLNSPMNTCDAFSPWLSFRMPKKKHFCRLGGSRGNRREPRWWRRLQTAAPTYFGSRLFIHVRVRSSGSKFSGGEISRQKFCFFAFLRYVNGFVASRIPFRRFVEVHARRVKCGFGDHLAVTHSPVTSHIALRTNTNSRDEAITLEFDSLSVRLTLHCRLTLCWESGKRKKKRRKEKEKLIKILIKLRQNGNDFRSRSFGFA